MAVNSNPARITDEIWWLWEQLLSLIPGVRLGGIFAAKACYHNTVLANKASWPSAYCIRLALDLMGLLDKARALDLTMSAAEMIKRTRLLRSSMLDPRDTRLFGIREFIGTIDGTNVTCYIKDSEAGTPRFDGTRDSSHLWHIHLSFFTRYCNSAAAMRGVLSVLNGETFDQYQRGGTMLANYGDSGPIVVTLQLDLQEIGADLGEWGWDGKYGNATAAAIVAMGLAGGDTTGRTYGAYEYRTLQARIQRQRFAQWARELGAGIPEHSHPVPPHGHPHQHSTGREVAA